MRLGLITALLIILLDYLTKQWALSYLEPSMSPREINAMLNMVMVHNAGISFGMLSQNSIGAALPLAIAAIMLSVLIVWLSRSQSTPQSLAIGLIIGGAIGNVIDRVRFGAVIDFIDVHYGAWHWPAFNLADSAICIGVAFLCWQTLILDGKKKTV